MEENSAERAFHEALGSRRHALEAKTNKSYCVLELYADDALLEEMEDMEDEEVELSMVEKALTYILVDEATVKFIKQLDAEFMQVAFSSDSVMDMLGQLEQDGSLNVPTEEELDEMPCIGMTSTSHSLIYCEILERELKTIRKLEKQKDWKSVFDHIVSLTQVGVSHDSWTNDTDDYPRTKRIVRAMAKVWRTLLVHSASEVGLDEESYALMPKWLSMLEAQKFTSWDGPMGFNWKPK